MKYTNKKWKLKGILSCRFYGSEKIKRQIALEKFIIVLLGVYKTKTGAEDQRPKT